MNDELPLKAVIDIDDMAEAIAHFDDCICIKRNGHIFLCNSMTPEHLDLFLAAKDWSPEIIDAVFTYGTFLVRRSARKQKKRPALAVIKMSDDEP
jgi:hypothetical protein